jgi:hypothetical protein
VDRRENNNQLNGMFRSGTFAVESGGDCRFIRLANVGRNHNGTDCLKMTVWEIFGTLVE